jgi:hypothetical protein
MLPRLASVQWHSVTYRDQDTEIDAVLYSVPYIGGNDSLTYLELFQANNTGPVLVLDRMFLGGRDGIPQGFNLG